jgi:hypothetical protein
MIQPSVRAVLVPIIVYDVFASGADAVPDAHTDLREASSTKQSAGLQVRL